MSASGLSSAARTEAQHIESLRKTYEDRGFTFVLHPETDALPSFLLPFRPDAIAGKPGENIIIEVKTTQNGDPDRSLADLRRRLSPYPDWKLDVVYMLNGEPEAAIPSVHASVLQKCIGEIEALSAAGHARAAFLLAWSALEASLNAGTSESRHPRTAAQIVQLLAMNGHIEPEKEPQLLTLAYLRNRLAHGDLSSDASKNDIDFVLDTIKAFLVAKAA